MVTIGVMSLFLMEIAVGYTHRALIIFIGAGLFPCLRMGMQLAYRLLVSLLGVIGDIIIVIVRGFITTTGLGRGGIPDQGVKDTIITTAHMNIVDCGVNYS